MQPHYHVVLLFLALLSLTAIADPILDLSSPAPWRVARAPQQTHKTPYNVLLILPEKESNNDKFGLTMEKAKPVIDIAIEDITKQGIMPTNWINLTYHDSRYWEDSSLAERWATTGVVEAYCERRLDAILGFADSYSLATVAKISAGFGNGIPILTTAGLTSQIGSKKNYPYLIRMQGSYRQMAVTIFRLIAYHGNDTKLDSNLNYKNLVYFYHDQRRAINRPHVNATNGEETDSIVSSHCYFSLYAIKNYFAETSDYFKEAWKIQTPSVAFNEEVDRSRMDVKNWLKMVSMYANGKNLLKIYYYRKKFSRFFFVLIDHKVYGKFLVVVICHKFGVLSTSRFSYEKKVI